MKRFFSTLFAILLFISVSYAGNTHKVASEARERQAWWNDAFDGWVVSGCSPSVPAASLTITAFSCKAYAKDNGELYYIDQPSNSITVPNSATVWLAIHRDRTSTVSGWTRVTLTHYLYQANASQPTTPAGAVIFAKVTVAASVISAIGNFAYRSPTDAANQMHSIAAWGALCDGSTDDATAIQNAIDASHVADTAQNGVFLGEKGTCKIGSTLTLTGLDTFIGGATLQWSGAAGGTMIDASNASGITIAGVGDHQMTINCNNGGDDAGIGLKMGGGAAGNFQSVIRNVNVYECDTIGIDGGAGAANGSDDLQLINVEVKSNGQGLNIIRPNVRVVNSFFQSNTTAVVVQSNAKIDLFGTIFSLNNHGIQIADGAVGVYMAGGWFEANASATCAHIYFADPGITVSGSLTFDGVNWQSCNTDATAADGVGYFLDANNMDAGAIIFHGGLFSQSNPNGKTFRVGNGTTVRMVDFQQHTAGTTITWAGMLNRCMSIYDGLVDIGCGGSAVVAGGNIRNLVLPNANAIRYRNNADNDSLDLITSDASDNVFVGDGTGTTSVNIRTGGKTTTFTADSFTTPTKAAAPATCSIGDWYVDTSGAYCACTATNTWENMTATGACS